MSINGNQAFAAAFWALACGLASSASAGEPATSGTAPLPVATSEAAAPAVAAPPTATAPAVAAPPSVAGAPESGAPPPAPPPPVSYVPPPAPRNPYTDPAWLTLFWSDDEREKAIEWLPDDRKPDRVLTAPGALVTGIVVLIASPISLFAGLGKTVSAMGGIWDCDGSYDPSCESDRSEQRTLGALGIVGGFLGVATGVTLTVIGATSTEWLDPDGNPIPKPEELYPRAASGLRVDVAFGPGTTLLRGAW